MNNKEVVINNEYDYSNIIPEVQIISYLVQYCNNLYDYLMNLINLEEERNEKLKYEFKNYEYKKSYQTKFEVSVRGKSISSVTYKNYDSFLSAVNSGQVNNVESLTIILDMSYKRGTNVLMEEHQNLFKMTFKPYSITFTRSSNFNEDTMNQIETNINDIFKNFRVQNSIFCTK